MDFPNKPVNVVSKPDEKLSAQPIPNEDFEQVMPLPPQTIGKQEPNPDKPSWSWLIALGVWISSIIFLFSLQILVGGVYAAIWAANNQENLSAPELAQAMTANAGFILWSVISVIPAHLLTIFLVWLIVSNRATQPFLKTLGWNWWKDKNLSLKDTVLAYIACVVLSLVVLGIGGLVVSYFGEQETQMMKILRSSREAVFVTAFLATFTAPFVEEIVYRGVLYSAFQEKIGKIGGIIVVTALFALVHVPQYFESIGVILVICFLSLILTIIRAATGNIYACFVIHTIFNGIQSLGLILYPESLQPKPSAEAFYRFCGF